MLDIEKTLVVKARTVSGERKIKPGKWWIDRHTERGEPADLYEEKPYGGKRYIPRKTIIRQE